MDMNTRGTDELETVEDCKRNGMASHFDREEMEKSQKVCSPQNSDKVINECDSQGDKFSDSLDRCDLIEHTHSAFAYVPFNSPQEGFSGILHSREQIEGNMVLDEVSKTLASLYCDDRYIDKKVPHSKCLKNNNEPTEVENHEDHFTVEESQNAKTDTDVKIVTVNQDVDHFCNEEKQCAEKLSQCEISEQESCVTRLLSSECLQHNTSVSDQIKFACQLELMPACLQKVADQTENSKICISECSHTDQKSPSQKSDLNQKNRSQLAEISVDGSIPMDVLGNDSSQSECSCHSEPTEKTLSNDYMSDESGKNCLIQSDSPDGTKASDYPAFDCCSLPNTEMHGLMETSNVNEIPSSSNDNDCDFIESFGRQLIADVKITLENLLEKCCNVFGEHDENANTSFNQYAGKQRDSGVNRLDMRVENESGLYSECTSLAECLKAGSGHTNSSTINEANTSDLMKIGEPSADCQVPMAMPCHDNKQQEIGKSHENVAALVLHSSQNDICGVGQCIQASPKLMASSIQFTQVSTNLMQNESMLIGTPPFSQKHGSNNGMLRCGEDLHAEDLKLNEALILRNLPLKKDDLISGNSGSDAFSDQVEMQVPEISLQEALLSSTHMPVTDFHRDIAMIEEQTRRKDESGTGETALDLRREIYTGENKPSSAYYRSEDLEKRGEIADKNVGEIGAWDQCTKFEDFHKEDVHSAEDVECESEILPAETNDDISHPSSSFKALSPDTCKGALTIHTKMNENVMDLHGISSQELLVGNVSESKNTVNTAHIGSTGITSEIDLTVTVPNNPFPQSTVLSENNKSAADMQNTCLQSCEMRKAVSYITLPVSEKNNSYNQLEDYQLMSSQQFSASLSQANIVDYLSDNRDNQGLQTTILSTFKNECSVQNTENEHIVPSLPHPSEYDCDVTMYDDSSHCLMKEKEHTKMELSAQQPSCFKWKYAPSLNFDDIPVNSPDSKHYDEEALLTVLPLKTCTRPIRVGLSKKYRVKSLHNKNLK